MSMSLNYPDPTKGYAVSSATAQDTYGAKTYTKTVTIPNDGVAHKFFEFAPNMPVEVDFIEEDFSQLTYVDLLQFVLDQFYVLSVPFSQVLGAYLAGITTGSITVNTQNINTNINASNGAAVIRILPAPKVAHRIEEWLTVDPFGVPIIATVFITYRVVNTSP